ncbi:MULTISPECIES: glutaredoxin family protein [unclassified Nostoc]|uniref:glutaredoxin family protein n=1 Tax=unclassified Nostoc TaxID=2593658 RepID=UPI002608F75E|nr:glutaredoxin family protein [Nostoc sp. S13]MDF5737490.1 glutaredoxin family protein [Nostoc sp. S13]
MRLILYSKPGCHLCEGLQEKLEQIQNLCFELEIRDITTRKDWFAAYEYEVPVLFLSNHRGAEEDTCVRGFPPVEQSVRGTETEEEEGSEKLLPRPSPRANVQQLEQMLRKYLAN